MADPHDISGEPSIPKYNLRFGKLPAKHDPKGRTIKFKSILNEPALPLLPSEYEFRKLYPQFDLSPKMWKNDEEGDCVTVSSFGSQREFEVFEQGKLLDIDEEQLVQSYRKESGGNYGLVMLDHMKVWKNDGLPIGYGKKLLCLKRPQMHKIAAFARIDPQSVTEIKYATFLTGCNIGVLMPGTYGQEFYAGEWKDTSFPPDPNLGHAMKAMGFTQTHLLLWSWGREIPATWEWVSKYSDEAWAIIDKIDDWIENSPIDAFKLQNFLDAIDKMS